MRWMLFLTQYPDSNNRQVKVSFCCSFAFLLVSYLIVLLSQCFAYFLVLFGHKKHLDRFRKKITFQLQIPVSVATNMAGNCLLNSLLKIKAGVTVTNIGTPLQHPVTSLDWKNDNNSGKKHVMWTRYNMFCGNVRKVKTLPANVGLITGTEHRHWT